MKFLVPATAVAIAAAFALAVPASAADCAASLPVVHKALPQVVHKAPLKKVVVKKTIVKKASVQKTVVVKTAANCGCNGPSVRQPVVVAVRSYPVHRAPAAYRMRVSRVVFVTPVHAYERHGIYRRHNPYRFER